MQQRRPGDAAASDAAAISCDAKAKPCASTFGSLFLLQRLVLFVALPLAGCKATSDRVVVVPACDLACGFPSKDENLNVLLFRKKGHPQFFKRAHESFQIYRDTSVLDCVRGARCGGGRAMVKCGAAALATKDATKDLKRLFDAKPMAARTIDVKPSTAQEVCGRWGLDRKSCKRVRVARQVKMVNTKTGATARGHLWAMGRATFIVMGIPRPPPISIGLRSLTGAKATVDLNDRSHDFMRW